MFKFEMGMKVRDIVTGFEGIVTGRIEYITGCNQMGITPQSKDNKKEETSYIDENRLELIEGFEKIIVPTHNVKGCDQNSPLK